MPADTKSETKTKWKKEKVQEAPGLMKVNRVCTHSDPIARGQRVFRDNGCGGCHTIEGLTSGSVGPALTLIGEIAGTRI